MEIWETVRHYVEYAPGVLAMAVVLWRIDLYARRIVDSCVRCWDKDTEAAHERKTGLDNPG